MKKIKISLALATLVLAIAGTATANANKANKFAPWCHEYDPKHIICLDLSHEPCCIEFENPDIIYYYPPK